jgi:1,2-diacylglycerol 3-alpha-glucosyltransferase
LGYRPEIDVNIVHICDFYGIGLEYQENIIARYAARLGHRVSVITSLHTSAFDYIAGRRPTDDAPRVEMAAEGKIVRLPYSTNLFNRLKWFLGIDETLREEKPDIIFVHGVLPDLKSVSKYRRAVNPKCKVMVDFHADYSNSAKNWLSLRILNGTIRRKILHASLADIDSIYAVTPGSAEFLAEVYRIPNTRIEILPLGADVEAARAARAKTDRAAMRTALGIARRATVVFTGGKLAPPKKTELLIQAAQNLGDSVHIIVAGDADEVFREYRDSLIATARDARNVSFTGWQTNQQILQLMAISDLAVFPASQSILWQQAISMGLPLIVGDSGRQDISYLNAGNILILQREAISVQGVTDAVSGLIRDQGALSSMSRAADSVTAQRLDWNELVHRTIEPSKGFAVPYAIPH